MSYHNLLAMGYETEALRIFVDGAPLQSGHSESANGREEVASRMAAIRWARTETGQSAVGPPKSRDGARFSKLLISTCLASST
jgi:hypothetical protein